MSALPELPSPAYRGPLSGEPFWNSLQMREFRKQALEEAEKLLWIHQTTLAQSLAIKELLK